MMHIQCELTVIQSLSHCLSLTRPRKACRKTRFSVTSVHARNIDGPASCACASSSHLCVQTWLTDNKVKVFDAYFTINTFENLVK